MKMNNDEEWTCLKPCKAKGIGIKDWQKHLREKHNAERICRYTAPLFRGFVICDKWAKHRGKHEALGYEWFSTDDCKVCGKSNGANEKHWREKHLNEN